MSDCTEIEVLLGAFQDGELEAHEMREVARHLAGCDRCEATLAGFAALGNQLRTALPEPVLRNFATDVDARLTRLAPSPLARLRRFLDSFNQRLVTGLALGSATLAVAALSALIVTPWARDLMANHGSPRTPAAMVEQIASGMPEAPAASHNSHAVISRLVTERPSVAVWSEPKNDTTVIWVPDEP